MSERESDRESILLTSPRTKTIFHGDCSRADSITAAERSLCGRELPPEQKREPRKESNREKLLTSRKKIAKVMENHNVTDQNGEIGNLSAPNAPSRRSIAFGGFFNMISATIAFVRTIALFCLTYVP